MDIKEKKTKGQIVSLCLLALFAVLITVAGIVFRQSALRIAPLYVSLVIGFLQSKASRYAHLLGAFNCFLYTAAYFSFRMYATAISTILFSLPLQSVTFWLWSKKSYKQSTEFRTLKAWQWLVGGAAFAVAYAVIQFALTSANSNHPFLDNAATLVGFLVSVLSLLSFREYSWFMLLSGAINLLMFGVMTREDPAQSTYLIYAVHSMICMVAQFCSVQKLYAEQRAGSALKGNFL